MIYLKFETLNNKIENDLSEIYFANPDIISQQIQNIFNISRKRNINQNYKEKCEYYLYNLFPISNINSKFCENESLINKGNKNCNTPSPLSYPLIINPIKTSLTITDNNKSNKNIFNNNRKRYNK